MIDDQLSNINTNGTDHVDRTKACDGQQVSRLSVVRNRTQKLEMRECQ